MEDSKSGTNWPWEHHVLVASSPLVGGYVKEDWADYQYHWDVFDSRPDFVNQLLIKLNRHTVTLNIGAALGGGLKTGSTLP